MRKETEERKDSLLVLKETCLAQELEKRKWKNWCQLTLSTWLPIHVCFPGPQGKTHFFLRVELYCRNSCNLPECYKRSLQDSLSPRFLTSFCCLLHSGHPWRRKAGLRCCRWDWHLCCKRRTQALSLEGVNILEEAWASCARHCLLYGSFSTCCASWKRDQARKNMWCYSKLKPKTWLWACPSWESWQWWIGQPAPFYGIF